MRMHEANASGCLRQRLGTVSDFFARPHEDGAVVCDFCAGPNRVVWAYRAGPTCFVDLSGRLHSLPAGDWYSCGLCRGFVDHGRWHDLARILQHGSVPSAWLAFARTRSGAGRPWPPPPARP